MTGILIFTNQDVLNHKLKDGKESDGNYCYWSISRYPVKMISRLYIAVNGQVKGYFKISYNDRLHKEIHFHSESWTPIENGEVLKPSQGWRYYLHKK